MGIMVDGMETRDTIDLAAGFTGSGTVSVAASAAVPVTATLGTVDLGAPGRRRCLRGECACSSLRNGDANPVAPALATTGLPGGDCDGSEGMVDAATN